MQTNTQKYSLNVRMGNWVEETCLQSVRDSRYNNDEKSPFTRKSNFIHSRNIIMIVIRFSNRSTNFCLRRAIMENCIYLFFRFTHNFLSFYPLSAIIGIHYYIVTI